MNALLGGAMGSVPTAFVQRGGSETYAEKFLNASPRRAYPMGVNAPACRGSMSATVAERITDREVEAARDLPLPLTGKQKVILMLRKAGMEIPQIADRMGITEKSARRLLQRAEEALQNFRKAVEHYLSN